jgi:hypothetical protein
MRRRNAYARAASGRAIPIHDAASASACGALSAITRSPSCALGNRRIPDASFTRKSILWPPRSSIRTTALTPRLQNSRGSDLNFSVNFSLTRASSGSSLAAGNRNQLGYISRPPPDVQIDLRLHVLLSTQLEVLPSQLSEAQFICLLLNADSI